MKITNLNIIDPASITNIIFDWGGVITELDFEGMNTAFSELGISDFHAYFSKHGLKDFFRKFELGQISPETFRAEIGKLCEKGTTAAQIDKAWNTILSITPSSRIDILKQLKEKYNLYLLSNTNEIHTKYYNAKLLQECNTNHFKLFRKVYYSNELGLRKPGVDIFRYILKDSELVPEECLFIDDTELNIDPAAELGIRSYHLGAGSDIAELFKDW